METLCTASCSCSVAQSGLTLCNTMDCSTPGFPVLHHLPELGQTHVHRVGDVIQPSHPLLSPSLPAFNLSQHSGTSLSLRKVCLCNQITVPEKCLWNFSFCGDPSLGTKVDHTHLAKNDLWKESTSFAYLEYLREQDKGQPFSLWLSCILLSCAWGKPPILIIPTWNSNS